MRCEVRELSQAQDSGAVGALQEGAEPPGAGQIPQFDDITGYHTLREVLLSYLAQAFSTGGNAIEGAYAEGGNIFYYSFRVTGIKLGADPEALKKPQ